TLTDVTYGTNSSGALGNKYNYTISGSSTGLSWSNSSYSGGLAGDAKERNDTGNLINWSVANTCQNMISNGSGKWSSISTWNTAFIPTSCNVVTVRAGDTVHIDTNTAVASTTSVNGTMYFNRSGDNELMLFTGTMTVVAGGTLDMGSDPASGGTAIPSGTTA